MAKEVPTDSQVDKKLREYQRRWRFLEMLKGIFLVLFILLILVFFSSFADRFSFLTSGIRYLIATFIYGIVVVTFVVCILGAIYRRMTLKRIAKYVEMADSHLNEKLITAVELEEDKEIWDSLLFRQIIREETIADLKGLKVKRLFPFKRIRKYSTTALTAIILTAVLCLIPGFQYPLLITRALVPFANLPRASTTQIVVKTGDKIIPQGNELTISAQIFKLSEEENVYLFTKRDGQKDLKKFLMSYDSREKQASYKLSKVDSDITYFIRAGYAQSKKYQVDTLPQWKVKCFHKTYHYPKYTLKANLTKTETEGDIEILENSSLDLAIEANQPLEKGYLRVNNQKHFKLSCKGNRAEIKNWLPEEGFYHIFLASAKTGVVNTTSPKYPIRVHPDSPPKVKLSSKLEEKVCLPNATKVLKIEAKDDFGIKELRQKVQINSQPWKTVPIQKSEGMVQRLVKTEKEWPLKELNLRLGDTIRTLVEAIDSKGNTTSSEILELRIGVVNLAQMAKELARRENEAEKSTRNILKSREEEISPEQEQERIQQALQKQKSIDSSLDTFKEKLKRRADILDLVKELDRARARDYDDILAMLSEEPELAQNRFSEALVSLKQKVKKEVLVQAVGWQKKMAENLELASKLLQEQKEQREPKSRTALRAKEKELGVEERLSYTYEQLEKLAELIEKERELTEAVEEQSQKTKDLAQRQESLRKEDLQEFLNKYAENLIKQLLQENIKDVASNLKNSHGKQKQINEAVKESLGKSANEQAIKTAQKAASKIEQLAKETHQQATKAAGKAQSASGKRKAIEAAKQAALAQKVASEATKLTQQAQKEMDKKGSKKASQLTQTAQEQISKACDCTGEAYKAASEAAQSEGFLTKVEQLPKHTRESAQMSQKAALEAAQNALAAEKEAGKALQVLQNRDKLPEKYQDIPPVVLTQQQANLNYLKEQNEKLQAVERHVPLLGPNGAPIGKELATTMQELQDKVPENIHTALELLEAKSNGQKVGENLQEAIERLENASKSLEQLANQLTPQQAEKYSCPNLQDLINAFQQMAQATNSLKQGKKAQSLPSIEESISSLKNVLSSVNEQMAAQRSDPLGITDRTDLPLVSDQQQLPEGKKITSKEKKQWQVKLPPKLQQVLAESQREDLPPMYQKMVEEYFYRLAEKSSE